MFLASVLFGICLFLSSALGQKYFIRFARAKKIMDIPNDRSSHTIPTPRGGGIVIAFLTLLAGIILFFITHKDLFLYTFLASGIVSYIGFKDDYFGASIQSRLIVHFSSGLLIAGYLVQTSYTNINVLSLLILSVLVVLLVFSINVYNFMDGIDGMCGGFSAAVLFWMSVLMGVRGHLEESYFAMTVVLILVGFLFYNWSPARVFLGDVGSGFLGALVTGLFFSTLGYSYWTTMTYFILNAAFFSDTLCTLVLRALRKEKIYLAHRQHAYQHASLRWKSHQRVSLYYIGYTFFFSGPLAFMSTLTPHLSFVFLLLVYLPATLWALKNNAGRP